jgi:NRPS condensation-like uncharacterized protein
MFLHLDDPVRPLTIQLEARVRGRLDEARLRDAIGLAAGRHHLARARLLPWRSDARSYEWHVDEAPQLDPLRVVDEGDAGPLDLIRSEHYSRAVPLSESPPFRALLVHDPGGDFVMLAINHVACDGIGALRLMQSIGRAYAGVSDPTVDMDPSEALRQAVPQGGSGVGDLVQSGRLGVQQLAQMRSRAAQVAAKDPSAEPGYGVHSMTYPVSPLVSSELRRRVGATVNDALLAAVHRSIEEWNRRQGKGTGRVSLSMPVNGRPEAWRTEVVGNLISTETVWTSKGQRETPETCLAAVAGWTDAVKQRGSGQALAMQARGWGGRVSHRRALSRVTKIATGLLSGTSAVSNLGRVSPDWVDGADFEVTELWVSPPAVSTGLSFGAISTDEQLHLSLRSSPAVLSPDAVAEFADVLRSELDLLA